MKWEYKVVAVWQKSRLEIEVQLCCLGSEGWELLSVGADYAYLKRQIVVKQAPISARMPPRVEKVTKQ